VDANLELYQKANGTYKDITNQLLTFQIVGVMAVTSNSSNTYSDIHSFVNSLLSVNYLNGAFIPNQLYDKLPAAAQYKNILQNHSIEGLGYSRSITDAGIGETIVAFPSIQQAQDFINKDTCYNGTSDSCKKPWTSQMYGSNYLLIGDFGKFATSAMKIALPAALILAGIIIWIAMARVITDSRRETAVFRALGAKRIDIMRIYIVYSAIVAVLIIVFALVMGAVGVTIIQILYGSQATNYAKVAYGVFDQLQPFSFIGININLILVVIIAIILVSLIAVLPPLVRNVRRNPIRDMRDEN
jgi:ABC-type antimicrobial peptide transport system permease subunit